MHSLNIINFKLGIKSVERTFKIFSLCCVMFSVTNTSYSQNHYLLDDFKAFRDNERVILNWTIKQGSFCIGIGVYRSPDNVNYEKIHDIFGECGSSSKPVPYTYVDNNPIKNSKNYYILELGFSGRTEPVQIEFIDFNDTGYQLKPNPIVSESILIFQNEKRTDYILTIFDSYGISVRSIKNEKDYFIVNNETLSSGVYFFQITEVSGKTVLFGKFVSVK
ncbi:MAG: T9SS type A sorting domain-containing protein [Saprospiraceae bacterium]|nr:T9SS type A sorting domain-containing protein [Saprospiraceae bacterium]